MHEHSNLSEAADNNVETIVLPIFYGVNPSDVRHQRASFAIHFAKYEEKYKDKPERVKRWRTALSELANIVGWDSKNRRETELIQDIVETIWTKLHPSPSKPAINNVPSMPKNDVFLSFRGKDTRLNFVDHLDAALIRRGISTFRDDKHLEKGISISKQLVKAIKGSKVSVVIVSPNYASSKWCLNELLKILESRKLSKVGNKNGTLMRVFTQQEEKARNLESYKINKWKASLQNKETNSKHNKSLSSGTGFKKPLQNASERMESSENSGTAQFQRYGTYHGYFRGVTPNPVLFLNQHQPYNQEQHTTWQPYYEHYKPSYHQLQWDYRQPQSSYQQLSQVHHYHGYFHGVTPNPVPYLNQNQPYSQQQHTTWQPY